MLRNGKKMVITPILIIALLLLGAVSVNAATTAVERVDIKTTKAIPEIGDKVSDLDYDFEVYVNETTKLDTPSTNGEVTKLSLSKLVNGKCETMKDDDVFEKGYSYIITRSFYVPNEMELIDPNTHINAYINGERVYGAKDSGSGDTEGRWFFIETRIVFDEKETIEKVNIKSEGLSPKAGETVKNFNKDYEVFANDTVKLSNSLKDEDNVRVFAKENGKELNNEDTFEAGKTYFIQVWFVVSSEMTPITVGGEWSDMVGFLTKTEGMLNGQKVGYVAQSGSGCNDGEYCNILIEYTVPEEKVNNENIEDVTNNENQVEVTDNEKDDTPKTGIENGKIVFAIFTMITLSVVALMKKENK